MQNFLTPWPGRGDLVTISCSTRYQKIKSPKLMTDVSQTICTDCMELSSTDVEMYNWYQLFQANVKEPFYNHFWCFFFPFIFTLQNTLAFIFYHTSFYVLISTFLGSVSLLVDYVTVLTFIIPTCIVWFLLLFSLVWFITIKDVLILS